MVARLVKNGDLVLPRTAQEPDSNCLMELLRLLRAVSEEYGRFAVYRIPGGRFLRILYPDSCCETELFLREYYSPCFELASSMFPFSLNGQIGEFEDARIECTVVGDKIILKKYDASGSDFQILQNFYFKVEVDNEELCNFLEGVLKGFCAPSRYLCYAGSVPAIQLAEDLFRVRGFFYYHYVDLEAGEIDYSQLLRTLDIDKIAGLWRVFFQDGSCPEEFERMWELLEAGDDIPTFPWIFALKLVMEAGGIQSSYEKGRFVVTGASGRAEADFEYGTAAEKLLLKFLYPTVPT